VFLSIYQKKLKSKTKQTTKAEHYLPTNIIIQLDCNLGHTRHLSQYKLKPFFGPKSYRPESRGCTSDFLLALVMRPFFLMVAATIGDKDRNFVVKNSTC